MSKRHFWSASEIAMLTSRYPDSPSAEIATLLGLTLAQVYSMAFKLGIKKSATYLASPAACRLRRDAAIGRDHRFKPGQPAWNRGMKGLQMGGEATRFKKGQRSGRATELYKPVGFERISKDGYLERKINDDMPLQKRWRAVHLLVWEAANGQLPKGHAISFKDGDKRHNALANLELVSRADLMRRNTYHQYGPEIASLVKLRGVVTRQINRKGKTA